MPESRSWSDTLPCAGEGGQDMVAVFAGGGGLGEGEMTSYRGTDVRWAH